MSHLNTLAVLIVGVAIGVAIMAMLQMNRLDDDETDAPNGQVPPRRPPPAPMKMDEYPNWRDAVRADRHNSPSTDSARLDWLQESRAGLTFASKEPPLFAVIVGQSVVGDLSDDVRIAIDSARIMQWVTDETR